MSAVRTYPLWGHADLEKLRLDASKGMSLRWLATSQGGGITPADCDFALWTLVGRSTSEACDILNRRVAA